MNGVTYDTGALIAADRNGRTMWALHTGLLAEAAVVTVPAPRAKSRISPTSNRRVGVMSGNAAHDDIVDVTVVEGAIRRHDAVVTSNPTHIKSIADAERARLVIETI